MTSALADSNIRPHDRFFFPDGGLYLLVENSLYCLHKFLFEIHATTFPVRELETSRNKPYVLGDVNKVDFDRLLASLYPRTLWVEETETTQDWISILRLASKWGFESLRSRAISKIEQTLDSPIDMVILGRQYGIPTFLLPGYAVLCQSTVPLSNEEGLRLGMEDVLQVYRIRHELYGSGITPVPLEAAFAKVKEAGLGDELPRQDHDNEQTRTWADVGSVATLQRSAENEEERGSVTLTPNGDSPPLDTGSTDAATLVSELPEQQHIDVNSPSDEPTPVVLDNGGNDVPSTVSPDNVSDPSSRPLDSAKEGLDLVEELAKSDFNIVSNDIIQWFNTKDTQTLHQITRLIVEKAIEAPSESHPYARLCRMMVQYTQPLHQITRLIVEKTIEEPHRISACAQLFVIMTNDTNGSVSAVESLFRDYLGNMNDVQTLHQVMRLIVEKAIETPDGSYPCVRLCRAMLKYTQWLHQITRLIVEKAMEEPHRISFCAQLCIVMMKDTNGSVSADGSLFCDYLGSTNDIPALRQITQLIVEKAIEAPSESRPCVLLCRMMVKYPQRLHQITRLIVEKAMEEPHRVSSCVRLCTMMMKDTSGGVSVDGSLFRNYLGEICLENLETIAASVAAAAAGELTARVQRWRLLQFIGAVAGDQNGSAMTPTILDKWVTALLQDPNEEEKVATLCMAMARVGPLSASCGMNVDGWLQRTRYVAKATSKPRVQKLLKGVNPVKCGRLDEYRMTWFVSEPIEECTVQ